MSIESELEKTPEEHVDEISISSPKPTSAYSAFSPSRRLTILVIITAANCLGPLAGNIYLPAIPSLAAAFESSYAIINASVSAFMAIFAVAVSVLYFPESPISLDKIDILIHAALMYPAINVGQLVRFPRPQASIPYLTKHFCCK